MASYSLTRTKKGIHTRLLSTDQLSQPYPLNLVQGDPVPCAVVQARGLRRLVSGDGASVLETTAVGEVVG